MRQEKMKIDWQNFTRKIELFLKKNQMAILELKNKPTKLTDGLNNRQDSAEEKINESEDWLIENI